MNTVRVDHRSVTPNKVVCIGRNYVAHIAELGNEVPSEMVVFCKPNSAIGASLHSQQGGEPLHYEGEIALLFEGGRFTAAGFGLDLTKRQLQSHLKEKGLPWERAKAFDGAALFSDFRSLADSPDTLALELEVNGELRQSVDVSLMMYPPSVILRELEAFMTLQDGDIVMTGTPAGVGPVTAGDSFHGRILENGQLLAEGIWQAI